MSEYYNRQGEPITDAEWTRLFKRANDPYRRVGNDRVCNDTVTVSTVWLGMNHNYGDGPPLIFETMIFGGALNEDQWRYSTEAEAIEGHGAAIRRAEAAYAADLED